MKKNYVLMLATTEEKGYNKFCHLVEDCWDIAKENYPKMTMNQTEEEIRGIIKKLESNGFSVEIVSE